MIYRLPVLVVAIALLIGCRTVVVGSGPVGLVDAGEMGTRIGLTERRRTDDRVVLVNDQNVVIVFAGAGGRIWVNERAVGPIGVAKRVGDSVLVPEEIIPAVRRALRPAPAAPRPGPTPPEPAKPPNVVETPPPEPPTPRSTIVIDAGHGGRDPGAIGPSGTYEKTVNLAVALEVARLLRAKGERVVLTRSDDRFLELSDRAAVGNRHRAALFISLHSDATPGRKARGYTVFVRRGPKNAELRAAAEIEQAMKATGLKNRRVREANYRVLVESDGLAVLVEMGFLSNVEEEKLLNSTAFRKKLAAAIAVGIRASSAFVGAGSERRR